MKNTKPTLPTTKEKILRAAFLLLLEKGYDSLKVGDIQNELGISRGLLYRYFKNKSDLVYQACREYFYDRYFRGVDYDTMTLREFFEHVARAVRGGITNIGGVKVEMLKYNTLYSSFIQSEPKFKKSAQVEFDKARKVIANAVKRGEIKDLPENFIGATILAIYGRTSYITETPSNEYICSRILEDIDRFYDLIKR